MTNSTYISGRRKNARPQGMLWAENPGYLDNGVYVPNGFEVGTDPAGKDESLLNQFIILSDDNRSSIDFATERIEKRERMVNGRMRSYHIADKMTIALSWDMLPSRSFSNNPLFDSSGNPTSLIDDVNGATDIAYSGSPKYKDQQYTSDGGAGGVEILDWYNQHQGSFWVYLAYDNYANFGKDEASYQNLAIYNEVIEMFFSDFSYSVQRRGSSNFDFWNISVTMEEV